LGDFEQVSRLLPIFEGYFSRLILRDPGIRLPVDGSNNKIFPLVFASAIRWPWCMRRVTSDWTGYRSQQVAKRSHRRNTSDWWLCLAIDQMFAAHAFMGKALITRPLVIQMRTCSPMIRDSHLCVRLAIKCTLVRRDLMKN
jgi:hypothetical protein